MAGQNPGRSERRDILAGLDLVEILEYCFPPTDAAKRFPVEGFARHFKGAGFDLFYLGVNSGYIR